MFHPGVLSPLFPDLTYIPCGDKLLFAQYTQMSPHIYHLERIDAHCKSLFLFDFQISSE